MTDADKCACGKPADMFVTKEEGPEKGSSRFICFNCFLTDPSYPDDTTISAKFKDQRVGERFMAFQARRKT